MSKCPIVFPILQIESYSRPAARITWLSWCLWQGCWSL